ncbi:uncharacterized protein CLUP02_07934 [Colletotrichum lupini]|uniref:Uncharacterized protein n=1 Tax=Colletotrichum lupini TaxID=145971 RepID=A0A9Q8WGJ3_9PEZI|nr:uncharacterized protein CLUP02_07934 [Colletotrichum lupini]UQC82446.1 hypothetical protein CLUP02_07934 [Colletotrichum lupini]
MSGARKCQAAVDNGSGLSILREPGLANDDQAGPCCFNPTKNLVFRPSPPPHRPWRSPRRSHRTSGNLNFGLVADPPSWNSERGSGPCEDGKFLRAKKSTIVMGLVVPPSEQPVFGDGCSATAASRCGISSRDSIHLRTASYSRLRYSGHGDVEIPTVRTAASSTPPEGRIGFFPVPEPIQRLTIPCLRSTTKAHPTSSFVQDVVLKLYRSSSPWNPRTTGVQPADSATRRKGSPAHSAFRKYLGDPSVFKTLVARYSVCNWWYHFD